MRLFIPLAICFALVATLAMADTTARCNAAWVKLPPDSQRTITKSFFFAICSREDYKVGSGFAPSSALRTSQHPGHPISSCFSRCQEFFQREQNECEFTPSTHGPSACECENRRDLSVCIHQICMHQTWVEEFCPLE